MKNLIVFGAIILLIACTKDEACPPEQIIDNGGINAMDGEWHLSSVMALSAPVSYEIGEYVWDIDIDNETVNVDDNSDDMGGYLIEGGTYSLLVTEDSLFVNGLGFGLSTEELGMSLYNMPELDGPIHSFVREE